MAAYCGDCTYFKNSKHSDGNGRRWCSYHSMWVLPTGSTSGCRGFSYKYPMMKPFELQLFAKKMPENEETGKTER